MSKKYWVCIVEVDGKVPNGGDLPPREFVGAAMRGMCLSVSEVYSGWGATKETVRKIKDAWNES